MPTVSGPEQFAAAFSVSRETVDRLAIYAELLAKWQKTINLVAPSTLPEVWDRHFADSAQIMRLVPPGGTTWVDLGSGAGFPGLVLAIMWVDMGPGRAVLVESDTRKCAFLAEVVRKTGIASAITVEIINERIEKCATRTSLKSVDVVTARAVAPLDRLLHFAQPLFSEGTVAFLLKGREAEAEIEMARKMWQFDCELHASSTDAAGRIIEVRDLRASKEG